MLADLRRDSRDCVVVVRLDPEDPRRLGRSEAGGLGSSESDRDLSDEVAGQPLADDPLDSVDELDYLDMTLQESQESRAACRCRQPLRLLLGRAEEEQARMPIEWWALTNTAVEAQWPPMISMIRQ